MGKLTRRAFVLALALAGYPAGASAPAAVAPRETGVLLLPALDTEPWAPNVLAQRQLVVRWRLEHDFIERRFRVSGEALAERAAGLEPKIDLGRDGARTPANLDELARRAGAAWVVSLTVEEVAEDNPPDPSHFRCHCRILTRIRDAAHHRWLADGPAVGHDDSGSSSPVWLFMSAIDDATRAAVAPVLSPYPAAVKVARIGSIGDYLAGQTEPFVGDPAREFSGLKPQ
ncbi:MAG TPA: hypothetical protein VHV47_08830 [Opitutaceae bacterium]|nr:hypothetical protein [Opitutaceae bacterium]